MVLFIRVDFKWYVTGKYKTIRIGGGGYERFLGLADVRNVSKFERERKRESDVVSKSMHYQLDEDVSIEIGIYMDPK